MTKYAIGLNNLLKNFLSASAFGLIRNMMSVSGLSFLKSLPSESKVRMGVATRGMAGTCPPGSEFRRDVPHPEKSRFF